MTLLKVGPYYLNTNIVSFHYDKDTDLLKVICPDGTSITVLECSPEKGKGEEQARDFIFNLAKVSNSQDVQFNKLIVDVEEL